MASCTWSADLGPNSSNRKNPVTESTIRTAQTSRSSKFLRFNVTVNVSGSRREPRANRTWTLLPDSPAIRSRTVSISSPATTVSLMASTRSPGLTPAFSTGLCG